MYKILLLKNAKFLRYLNNPRPEGIVQSTSSIFWWTLQHRSLQLEFDRLNQRRRSIYSIRSKCIPAQTQACRVKSQKDPPRHWLLSVHGPKATYVPIICLIDLSSVPVSSWQTPPWFAVPVMDLKSGFKWWCYRADRHICQIHSWSFQSKFDPRHMTFRAELESTVNKS